MSTMIDMTGQRFGQLTVLELAENGNDGHKRWHCKCSCGKITVILGSNLRSGRTGSCGCNQWRETHGEAKLGQRTPEYTAWVGMHYRCSNNPNRKDYKDYGARGIEVCKRWRTYKKFLADLLATIGRRPSPRHSIDRIDNDGNYELGNIQWSTKKEQRGNQRKRRKSAPFTSETRAKISASQLGVKRGSYRKRAAA